jgi:intracellular multiplication protein IcmK
MKQKLKLWLLLLMIFQQPVKADILGSPGSAPELPPPTSGPNTGNTSAKPVSAPLPLPGQQAAQANAQAQNPAGITLPQDLSKLTPDQTKALMSQAKDMKPEQLQAIAKTLQSQGQLKQVDPNAGLIEETVQKQPAGTIATGAPAGAPGGAVGAAPEGAANTQSIGDLKREQAFNTLMEEVLPLSPDQIIDLHKFYDITLQAKAATPHAPPTPNFTSIVVNLDPGSQPPVIRLAAGFVTSILFVDSTGSAWPITAYSIGDPQSFNIQWDQKGNALFIQSMKQYSHGNLAVRLWGLDTPVMVTLVSGQRNVDFRVDLQVGGRGPDAKPVVVDTTSNAKVNSLLINILDGIPPKNSIKLGVTGGHGEAWFADGRVYFRTKLTVLSPAWTATVASPDGTHVYEMMLTPFILASENGKTIDIKLSGL